MRKGKRSVLLANKLCADMRHAYVLIFKFDFILILALVIAS